MSIYLMLRARPPTLLIGRSDRMRACAPLIGVPYMADRFVNFGPEDTRRCCARSRLLRGHAHKGNVQNDFR
jgi:hypothetical protein